LDYLNKIIYGGVPHERKSGNIPRYMKKWLINTA